MDRLTDQAANEGAEIASGLPVMYSTGSLTQRERILNATWSER